MNNFEYKSQTLKILLTLVLILLCTIFIIKYVKWQLSRQNMYKMANLLHQFPKKYVPIIGHCHHFFGNNEQILKTILMQTSNLTPESIWMGPFLVVHISRPEDFEKVFNNSSAISKSRLYDFGREIVGNGMFLLRGSEYKKHKKIILPALNHKILDEFVEIYVRHTNVLLDILETKKGINDFIEIIAPCTLDIVCETVMGVALNSQKSHCLFSEYFRRITDISGIRAFNIFLLSSFIYHLTPMCYEQKKIVEYIGNFTKDVLEKKREEMNKNRNMPVGSYNRTKKYKSLLESFLEISNNGTILSEQEIIDEVKSFLAAGFDATATEISFVLLMLAMFPEIQQKVYEEVIEVLGTDREVEISDLANMDYLERVIKETMRIFPIAPVIGRFAEEDIKLEKHTVPKGAEIFLSIINTHRNPEYFKDPLKFDPDRFLPEEVAKRHPYSYVPFSSGVRKCLGVKISYMFMKTMLSKLVRKFTFETPYKSIEEIRLKESLVLRTVDGFWVEAKPRK